MTRTTMVMAAVAALLPTAAPAQDAEAITRMREANGRIQFAAYPRDALRRGEEGIVGVSVVTDAQGRLRECSVSRSSGFPALDEASCELLLTHMKMRPYLAPGGGGIVRHQEGEIVWKLPEGYKPTAKALAAVGAGAPAGTKKICRVQVKTGSLIASQRICLTRQEWYQQYVLAQEETREMHPKFQPGN